MKLFMIVRKGSLSITHYLSLLLHLHHHVTRHSLVTPPFNTSSLTSAFFENLANCEGRGYLYLYLAFPFIPPPSKQKQPQPNSESFLTTWFRKSWFDFTAIQPNKTTLVGRRKLLFFFLSRVDNNTPFSSSEEEEEQESVIALQNNRRIIHTGTKKSQYPGHWPQARSRYTTDCVCKATETNSNQTVRHSRSDQFISKYLAKGNQ